MDKIKQALEKARNERAKAQASAGAASDSQAEPAAAQQSNDSFEYTKTRTVPGSPHSMHENRLINVMEQCEYTDSLKILSTQILQRMEEHQWSSLAVTAPRKGAGVSTMAVNLGLSIAREYEYTVLLVDANLREPALHDVFGITPERGLSEYLAGECELSDVLLHPDGISHFVVLPAGKPVKHSAELMGSPRMTALVSELTSRYPKRIIIFDLPSVLDTADTLSLVPNIDSALVVIEDDATKESDLATSVEMLSATNVLGTVLNKSVYY